MNDKKKRKKLLRTLYFSAFHREFFICQALFSSKVVYGIRAGFLTLRVEKPGEKKSRNSKARGERSKEGGGGGRKRGRGKRAHFFYFLFCRNQVECDLSTSRSARGCYLDLDATSIPLRSGGWIDRGNANCTATKVHTCTHVRYTWWHDASRKEGTRQCVVHSFS